MSTTATTTATPTTTPTTRRGGKRRRHVPAKLSPTDAEALRQKRQAGTTIKALCRTWAISPSLAYRVINRQGAYVQGGAA